MSDGIVEALGWEFDQARWTSQAACVGHPAELFFPGKGESLSPARALCASCPVRLDCLDYALRWSIPHGIWGGLSPRQRRHLRKPPPPTRLVRSVGCLDRCDCEACRQGHRRHCQVVGL